MFRIVDSCRPDPHGVALFVVAVLGLASGAPGNRVCAQEAVPKGLELTIATDRDSASYKAGESVTWTIQAAGAREVAQATPPATYRVLAGGLRETASGALVWGDRVATVTATRPDAGTLLLVAEVAGGDGKTEKFYGGAVFDADKIEPSAAPPHDFDGFWQAKLAELAAVPLNASLELIDTGDASIEYFHITLDNVRGSKIHGQLARPRNVDKLPAMLQVQWAGVYPLNRDWVVGHAKQGWLAMNISAHDLPIDEPEAFYGEQSKNALNDYPGQGNEDRETSYFLKMFLSCYRAADYLTTREDWNQTTLLVHGGSQGGYQGLVTAGLHPRVTAMSVNVPAGCDHTGKQAGRAAGWPQWASRTWQGKDETRMLNAARYFDAMNFATKIKCDCLVGAGLIDTVCPAEGVLATFNQIQGTKQLVLMPNADHSGDHQRFYEQQWRFMEKHRQATAVTDVPSAP